MAWHYALDVRSEADSYFCEKTLRNYRRLFIEQGLDELLFRCLTDRLVQGFSVDTSHQRMDSTALRSAMRALTRLGIVVESISVGRSLPVSLSDIIPVCTSRSARR